jgi:hypothetical protein
MGNGNITLAGKIEEWLAVTPLVSPIHAHAHAQTVVSSSSSVSTMMLCSWASPCAWHSRHARVYTEPYRLDALCDTHQRSFFLAVLGTRTRVLLVTTNDMLCVVSPIKNTPYYAVAIATNTDVPKEKRSILAQFRYPRHVIGPGRITAVSEFLQKLCTSCPTATLYGVSETRYNAAPPDARVGPYLNTPVREIDMRADFIVRESNGNDRYLKWDKDNRRHVIAQTLSCVFEQTHMPDPRLPEGGVLSLYAWAQYKKASAATYTKLWTSELAKNSA